MNTKALCFCSGILGLHSCSYAECQLKALCSVLGSRSYFLSLQRCLWFCTFELNWVSDQWKQPASNLQTLDTRGWNQEKKSSIYSLLLSRKITTNDQLSNTYTSIWLRKTTQNLGNKTKNRQRSLHYVSVHLIKSPRNKLLISSSLLSKSAILFFFSFLKLTPIQFRYSLSQKKKKRTKQTKKPTQQIINWAQS